MSNQIDGFRYRWGLYAPQGKTIAPRAGGLGGSQSFNAVTVRVVGRWERWMTIQQSLGTKRSWV